MTDKELLEIAEAPGFSAAIVSTEKIVVNPSFRLFGEENLCGNYNTNYSCPPDCGSVEEVRQRLMAKNKALVLTRILPRLWRVPVVQPL